MIILLTILLLFSACSENKGDKNIYLKPGVKIYIAENEKAPVKLAANILLRDLNNVLGKESKIVHSINDIKDTPAIVIINNTTKDTFFKTKNIQGEEAYSIYTDKDFVILNGSDMRGTIYAIYAFSEHFLDIPPLWFWASLEPDKKEKIEIKANTNIISTSPYVKFRAWFPDDMNMFGPWRELSDENNEVWLETMLRLKLNTVEWYDGNRDFSQPYKVGETTQLINKYGLINTTHHHSPLNASFRHWDNYWKQIKKTDPPQLILSNQDNLDEFWRYNIETIVRNNLDMLWVINFRGHRDTPFWMTFPDAPESMEERAAIINKMLKRQVELIKEVENDTNIYFRNIFYNEISDLLAMGLLHPPDEENLIWNFVAARRDHVPNDDLVNFNSTKNVKMGYYMNLQFTSTGSHLAQAEGPWKMEKNYRYIDNKSKQPLLFSVVNAGNIREHVLTLSANAAMLCDFKNYDSDRFILSFCKTYYGNEHAYEIAKLYKDFFYSYWNQKKSELLNFERQYIFYDLRYAMALEQLSEKFYAGFESNPLKDYPSEQVPNRTFRIVPEDNGTTNQVDAIIKGTTQSIKELNIITMKADALFEKLPEKNRRFFSDNLMVQAYFMLQINVAFHHYCIAYKNQNNSEILINNLEKSYKASIKAGDYLQKAAHDQFAAWYVGDRENRNYTIDKFQSTIKTTLDKAIENEE